MKKKKLPIGISDFREIIEENYYYVDKSLIIQELIDLGSKVSLITRPRRFGKTLNLSMLKCFFELFPSLSIREREATVGESPVVREASRTIFQNLKIWKLGEEYTRQFGKYPVVFLTFKDVKEANWESCYAKFKNRISEEYKRHNYLLKSKYIESIDKEYIQAIISKKASEIDYADSLLKLSQHLYQHYRQKVVVLIDEYDTPVHEAFSNGYYEKAIEFMRSFFGAGLKDNIFLEKGVITGILRVARENIFSDLNNLATYTVLNHKYSDKFGLLESEVKEMLDYYGLSDSLEGVKDWYDGYNIGLEKDIYNPWSIVNYIANYTEGFQPYWVNTSSNKMLKDLMATGDSSLKMDLEVLIKNQSIEKKIQSHTIFSDLDKSESIWTLFLFSGYLKIINCRTDEADIYWCELSIPNREVLGTFKRFLEQWFTDYLAEKEIKIFMQSLINEELETFEEILQKYVLNSFSYFDRDGREPEKVYHAFVLGLFVHLNDRYTVKSNAESGYGRYDVSLIPLDKSKKGIVIEFKVVNSNKKETLEKAVESALKQIEEKKYEAELLSLGIKDVLKLGIAFEGKKVKVGQTIL